MTLYFEYLLLVNMCGGLLLLFAVSRCLKSVINIRLACIILFLYTLIECVAVRYLPQLSGFLAAVFILVISRFIGKSQMVLHAAIILLFIFSSGSMTLYTINLLNFRLFYCAALLIIFLTGHYILSVRAADWISFSSVQATFICDVKLQQGKASWLGKGYLDSGNALSAPFSGKPVMFADANVSSELLPEEVVDYLNGHSECPDHWKEKISFIPSKSVHSSCEILVGVECEKVEVRSNGETFVFENIPVVFSKEQYYVEQSCHCLLSPMQMLQCYQK
ncbi:hypothetical protein JMA_16010 [Jeotgalibacillus malaysiensis]|uniref:Sporulation sigma-E factor-processing peptidase n=1 Tax=Jeotgalibacillus malaysiensis TaxID=1508404 RepID=A0A0B5AQW9_9BACL|nr:sigma-E processing peptidase SpoIIGA [Jeotgalibacillus malaysiensis]AJD90918.1 hypothetical protein JMA_16010 [Jeotgalibacillus malaysiensis]